MIWGYHYFWKHPNGHPAIFVNQKSRPPLGPNAKSAQQQQDLRDFPQPFFLEESQALWPKKVLGTEKAFAALLEDGRICSWGHLGFGGGGVWRRLSGGCCVTVDFDISYVIFVFFWGGYFGETLEFWLRR